MRSPRLDDLWRCSALLVLDEPFAGLAAAQARIVSDVLRHQTRRGRAVILSGGRLDPARWLSTTSS